ncbi:MAG: patatin-like phospholipase family protein [Bacteroidales bacterium]|nr:patatin-like phospholipase family protein [Bacteroidales bacterium]
MKKYNIGIALSGGGSRGFAHLGVLEALNEKGVYPEVVSGTSAGSIAGALYSSGMKPMEIYKQLQKTKFTDFTSIHLPKDGLFTFDNLRKKLEKIIQQKTFEELKTPLYICIANFNTGKAEYISKGPLHVIIQASCSIPVLISPTIINNTYYVDGGLIDNLPVKPLVRKCEKIIGVNISPYEEVTKIDNLFHVATRTFQISLNNNIRYNKSKCHLYIEPKNMVKYNMHDTKHSDELFEIGYNHVKKLSLKKLIK